MSIGGITSTAGYQVSGQYWSSGGTTRTDQSEVFSLLDADGDGSLTLDESGLEQDTFTKMDVDGDGYLSQNDLLTYQPPQGTMGQPPSAAEIIANEDTDGDGQLSADEALISSDQFSALDTDGDGYVTETELENSFAAMQQDAQAEMAAGQTMASASDIISGLDSDDDGQLSISESNLTEDEFSALDADGDGYVTESELEAVLAALEEQAAEDAEQQVASGMGQGQPPSAADIIADEDTDGDGQISAEETKLSSDQFSALDADGDGYLTEDEITSAFEEMEQSAAMDAMAPAGPPPSAEEIMAEEDADGDGQISSTETSMTSTMFDSMDTNQDGYVSQAELEAAQAQQQQTMASEASQAGGYNRSYGMAAYQSQMGQTSGYGSFGMAMGNGFSIAA